MKKSFTCTIFALLVSLLVSAQWSENPSENLQITDLPGEDAIPKIAVGPGGDYYIAYFSLTSGNYDVRLQRLDSNGNMLWEDNGLLVSDHPSMSWLTDWDLTVDHDNHAILTWQDIRMVGDNNTVAYRIAPDGTFTWGDDGIMLSNSANFDVSPKVAVTAANNAIFAWQSENEIIMQKISPDGTKQWGEWGISYSGTEPYSWPQLMPVGEDDFIMKFYEDGGVPWAPERHLLAQRFDSNGTEVWDAPVVISDDGTIQAWAQILSMVNDGSDGFFITWYDYSVSAVNASVRLQHIDNAGVPQFEDNGVLLSQADGNQQFYPVVAKIPNDPHAYVYWRETNANQTIYGIYGQKVAADGTLLWGDNGKVIIPLSSQNVNLADVQSVDDDVMLFLELAAVGAPGTNLFAARLNNEGDYVWDDEHKPVSLVNSSKTHLAISGFSNGQWAMAWGDNRDGADNVFAQNIRSDGSLGSAEDDLFSVVFHINSEAGEELDNAVVLFNGTENAPGDYVFENLTPGTYSYHISSACHADVSGEVVVAGVDLDVEITMFFIPGDANGDGQVDVLDVVSVVNHYLGLTPDPFCFHNADINQDGVVDVMDIILLVSLFTE